MNASTKNPKFLELVPQPLKPWAFVLVGCGAIIGAISGYRQDFAGYVSAHSIPLPHGNAIIGFFAGSLLGLLCATWMFCLGYVFADARRRAMPAVAWMFVAMLVPNCLGFLLYFVFRKPVAQPCGYCGQPVTVDQRFCSSCGKPGPAVPVQQQAPPPGFSPPAITQ